MGMIGSCQKQFTSRSSPHCIGILATTLTLAKKDTCLEEGKQAGLPINGLGNSLVHLFHQVACSPSRAAASPMTDQLMGI